MKTETERPERMKEEHKKKEGQKETDVEKPWRRHIHK